MSTSPSPPPGQQPPLTLRFNLSSEPDLPLPAVPPTVTSLLAQIHVHRPSLTSSHLRIIHSGRILAPSTLLSSLPPPPLYLQVAVSSFPSSSLAPPPPPTVQRREPRGFDRLLSAGFTAAEVAALRDQYGGGDEEAEEQWLADNADAGGGGVGGGEEGFYEEMAWGVVLGFLWPFGGWMVREVAGSPMGNGMWSRALIAGALVNLVVGVVRWGS